MRSLILLATLILTVSCHQNRILDLNPLLPNEGLYRSDLEKMGFTLNSADDGLCVYSKTIDTLYVFFLMEFDDDCNKVIQQGIKFPFGEFKSESDSDSINLVQHKYPIDITNDSIVISKIINDLGGKIVSGRIGLSPTHCRFEVINVTTKYKFSASIHYGTDYKKYLTIEFELNNGLQQRI